MRLQAAQSSVWRRNNVTLTREAKPIFGPCVTLLLLFQLLCVQRVTQQWALYAAHHARRPCNYHSLGPIGLLLCARPISRPDRIGALAIWAPSRRVSSRCAAPAVPWLYILGLGAGAAWFCHCSPDDSDVRRERESEYPLLHLLFGAARERSED